MVVDRVEIENFRCFERVEVTLKPFTVLVGENDTGKSTFLSAIERVGGARDFLQDDVRNRDLTSFVKCHGLGTYCSAVFEKGSSKRGGGRGAPKLAEKIKGVETT